MKLHIKSNEKIDGKVKNILAMKGLRTLTLSTMQKQMDLNCLRIISN
jgi:hypothetical protein